jgi:hypothetical protein
MTATRMAASPIADITVSRRAPNPGGKNGAKNHAILPISVYIIQ